MSCTAESGAIAKADLLRELGYGGDLETAERILEQAGLSRPHKKAIDPSKREAVQRELDARFVLSCARGDCQAEARRRASLSGREVAAASQSAACAVCAGSADANALDELVAACTRVGWRRLCVVGGSPNARTALDKQISGRLELRLVDGTASRTLKQARADTEWADRVVIWGATQLDHRVSTLYRAKVVAVSRRGLQELAAAVVRAASHT